MKRELLGLKWVGNTTRQLTSQERAPGWQGTVWCPTTNSSLQIPIFQIHKIFNISYFPQFNLSFQKKYLFPRMPKNHPKIYTKPPNSSLQNQQMVSVWRCLKRRKALLRDVKTAFTCSPALTQKEPNIMYTEKIKCVLQVPYLCMRSKSASPEPREHILERLSQICFVLVKNFSRRFL